NAHRIATIGGSAPAGAACDWAVSAVTIQHDVRGRQRFGSDHVRHAIHICIPAAERGLAAATDARLWLDFGGRTTRDRPAQPVSRGVPRYPLYQAVYASAADRS